MAVSVSSGAAPFGVPEAPLSDRSPCRSRELPHPLVPNRDGTRFLVHTRSGDLRPVHHGGVELDGRVEAMSRDRLVIARRAFFLNARPVRRQSARRRPPSARSHVEVESSQTVRSVGVEEQRSAVGGERRERFVRRAIHRQDPGEPGRTRRQRFVVTRRNPQVVQADRAGSIRREEDFAAIVPNGWTQNRSADC